MPCRKIAIIGSGISGMSAAWHLHRTHEITVFERSAYIGGHSNTVDISLDGKTFPVDTGFIVFNPTNYPNLTALFDYLGVDTTATDMSFAVSMQRGGFEYSGGDNAGLLAQPLNLFRPRFWRMVLGILRFYRDVERFEEEALADDLSLGALLDRYGFSRAFVEDHLAPMGAAIWSSDSNDILNYPAESFLKFFRNHGLVQLTDRPQWRTVVGGSREYVSRLTVDFRDKIHLSRAATRVTRKGDGIDIEDNSGITSRFDEVVFACHSDQALQLLSDPTTMEAGALSKMRYSKNTAVLHTDRSWMPKRRKAWASWNYMDAPAAEGSVGPAITYWMNRLQHLPVETPVMVTLNPYEDVAPRHVLGRFDYDHPIFDQVSHSARKQLMSFQGANRTWFAGAYLGDGFHEDGIQAGLAVAEMINGTPRPWLRPNQNARIGLPDVLITSEAAE